MSMRLAGFGSLLVFALSACSSSGASSGSTTGLGVTTGSGTTGRATTGGSTTGGSTGGGALAAGAPCSSDGQCRSGACGVDGTGNCCSSACGATADPACAATACDSSGLCVYNSSAFCAGTCANHQLTAGACNANGGCGDPATVDCSGNLNCNAAGTGCLTTCTGTNDCVSGYHCNGGACEQGVDTGPCTSNEGCTSGICGTSGTGHCCSATCSSTDASCGATDCDDTGACVYPSATTACGTPMTCSVSTQTNGQLCDGAGACLAATTTGCSPFLCGGDACITRCTNSNQCEAGNICDNDTLNGACCRPIAAGGALAVDSVTGSDATSCCGYGAAGPCQTLSHAMALINESLAKNVTINATVNGGAGDWGAEPQYPVKLGWGVELNAPGVNFLDVQGAGLGNVSIFEIDRSSANDNQGYVSIVGTAASPVAIGMDSTGKKQTEAAVVINVNGTNTLYIANAVVNGSAAAGLSGASFAVAIGVQAGASMMVGQDQSGAVTGTVTIGNALGNVNTDGWIGLYCVTDGVSSGCNVTDAQLVGVPSLVIQGQESAGMVISDFSNVNLRSNPTFGVPPTSAGFGNCPSKTDAMSGNFGAAIMMQGPSTLTLSNATIQCIGGLALDADFDTNTGVGGGPTVAIDKTTIQNTEVAVTVLGGKTTLTNSTIQFNFWGLYQGDDATANGSGIIDLSGGGNSVVCSDNIESSIGNLAPGISIYNAGSATLDADNTAFDTSGPDYFDCDTAFLACSCDNASCSLAANADGMSVVEDVTLKGGVSRANPTLSPIACH